MKKIIAGALLALMMTGCATTSGLEAKTSVSTFDGAKSVTIPAHGMNCTKGLVCDMIGFSWSSKLPDLSGFMVEIKDLNGGGNSKFYPIKVVKLNIDGEIVTLKPLIAGDGSKFDFDRTTLFKTTTRSYEAPISLLDKIKASNTTKTQIIAEGAVFEDVLKDSDKNSKAYYAMLRFLEQVEASK